MSPTQATKPTTLRDTRPYRLTFGATLLAAVIACGDDDVTIPPPAGPDTTPPQPIDDLALTYDSLAHVVRFGWTARRDDDVRDRADRYDIRYDRSFPFDWELSTRVDDPPAPLAAGTRQEFQLDNVPRGRDVFASIRAIDEAGNESAAGGVAHLRVPGYGFIATCHDALSQVPIEGLDATIFSGRLHHVATGVDGRITLGDLAGGTLEIDLARGSAATPYHTLTDEVTVDDDISIMYAMIPFQQPDSPLFPSILAILREANFSPGSEHIIKRWRSYPVQWYARDFVNVHGLDYRALTEQAIERWNTRLGFQMFEPVASDPAVGVLIEFLPRSVMGTVNGVTEYTSDAQGYPLHDRIRIVDEFGDGARLYSVLMHEVGHTIRLVHLPAGFIMYGSQPLPSDISDDEVDMVRLMLALPNGTVLDKYDVEPPAP